MPIREHYYAHAAFSASGVNRILNDTLAHYRADQVENTDSSDKRIGDAIHYMILTPTEFIKEKAIFSGSKTLESKGGEKFIEENPGKFCLSEHEYWEARRVVDNAKKCPKFKKLVSREGEKEKEIYLTLEGEKIKRLVEYPEAIYSDAHPDRLLPEWVYEGIDGCPAKAMLDHCDDKLIMDLKSTRDTKAKFERSFVNYGYQYQAVWYPMAAYLHDGKARDMLFVVLEKPAPNATFLVKFNKDAARKVRAEVAYAAYLYNQARISGNWPSYEFKVDEVGLPGYYRPKFPRANEDSE